VNDDHDDDLPTMPPPPASVPPDAKLAASVELFRNTDGTYVAHVVMGETVALGPPEKAATAARALARLGERFDRGEAASEDDEM